MPLFGPDPKDTIIEALQNERDYLRARVAELEKQLLAIHSTHAYRLVHGDNDLPPVKPGRPDPYSLKATDYEPEFSLAKVEALFSRKEGD